MKKLIKSKSRFTRSCALMAVGFGISLMTQVANSALVTVYDDINGTVDFTYDDQLLGLFMTPTVVGDSLLFSPIDFTAVSLNGTGITLTNETVNVTVTAHSGVKVDQFDVTERGDYLLLGQGVSVGAGGQLRVQGLSNSPIPEETSFLSSTGSFQLPPGSMHEWEMLTEADLTGAEWSGQSTYGVTMENLLYASSTLLGELGFIEKKLVILNATTSVIPIPAAVWLFGSALFGFVAFSRRRKV